MATTLLISALALALTATPAIAAGSDPGSDTVVDISITGTTAGSALQGLLPPTGPTPPSELSYPADDPAGYAQADRDAALLDADTLSPAGDSLQLYSVQVEYSPGVNYESVSRATFGNVNAGWAAQVVANSYPFTPSDIGPDELSTAQKIAAAQAAIWWYTDGFVLSTSDPLHDAVASIVSAINDLGPSPDDVATPGLALEGPTESVEPGHLAGPFTVESAGATNHTVDAGSATIYSDAQGAAQVPPGSELAVGSHFWVGSDTEGTVEVAATANVVTQPGQFYMSGDENQALISATAWSHSATATATAEFVAATAPPTSAPTSPEATSAPPTSSTATAAAPTTSATPPGDLATSGSDAVAIGVIAGAGALLVVAAGTMLLIARRRDRA